MANTLINPSELTKESLMVLHQKLNFITNIVTEYDDKYAQSGAKIGNSLDIRLPNQFSVRTGATLSAQDVTEEKTTLTVSTQKGVDINFTSAELTMDIDRFSERYIEPAMAALAANMESDALSMRDDVWTFVDGAGSAQTYNNIVDGAAKLSDNLAPRNDRCALHTPTGAAGVMKDVKDLYNDPKSISRQYKEGELARTSGLDHFENTLLTNHTSGTAAEGDTSYDVNGAAERASAAEISAGVMSLTVDGGTTTFLAGDIINIAGVNRVHPETKADTGVPQQFVVTADSGASATSLSISPPIIDSTASAERQNVSGIPEDNAAVSKVGGGASAVWGESLMFQKGAFAFGTADLVMPDGLDFSAREVMDGLSIRVVRQYDINNDKFPCRLDVLYGYKPIRPELAARVSHD